jgi:hypothetical protein
VNIQVLSFNLTDHSKGSDVTRPGTTSTISNHNDSSCLVIEYGYSIFAAFSIGLYCTYSFEWAHILLAR